VATVSEANEIRSVIQRIVKKSTGEPSMVGGFVLLAEITDEGGEPNLLTVHSEVTRWSEIGMLEDRLLDIRNDEWWLNNDIPDGSGDSDGDSDEEGS
jgi:hypothetical protein